MNQETKFHDLLDPSHALRVSALTGLSHLDDRERAQLRTELLTAPDDRRLQLVQNLVDLAEDNATLNFDEVFSLLLSDPDARVRRLAIDGLWENEDRSLIEPLVHLFNDDTDPLVRATAALALGRFILLSEFGTIRPRDAERVTGALRAVIDDPDEPVEVRARAIEAAGAASVPWATDMIWHAYDAEEPRLQLAAIHAMGRNSDSDWLPTLYDAMESDDPQRRYEAAHSAGQIGDEDAVPQLADLISDSDAEVQESAIAALGEIGGDLAVEALRAHLQESEPRVADALRAAIAEAQAAEGMAPGPIDPVALFADDDGDDDE